MGGESHADLRMGLGGTFMSHIQMLASSSIILLFFVDWI